MSIAFPLGGFDRFSQKQSYPPKEGNAQLFRLASIPNSADEAEILALHGMSKDAWKRFGDSGYRHYQVVDCGYKYNMTDIQAALGIRQFEKVEPRWLRRRELWQCYMEELAGLPLELPAEPEPETRHAYHLFTVLIDEERCGITRDEFLDEMTARNIGVGVHYVSLPEHPFYEKTFGWNAKDYPHAFRIGRQTVSLPLSAALTDSDAADVIEAVRDVFHGRRSRL